MRITKTPPSSPPQSIRARQNNHEQANKIYKLASSPDQKRKAKVHVMLKDFDKHCRFCARSLAEHIENAIPSAHLQGINAICFMPNKATKAKAQYISYRFSLKWPFYRAYKSIEIYTDESASLFYWALYHEIGHSVFDHYLSGKKRRYWMNRLHHRPEFVSAYAAKNGFEDFAESYACYVLEPQRLRKVSPKRYGFLRAVFAAKKGPAKQPDWVF